MGFFSPLPPEQSGVADYSAALLPALRKRGRVEIGPSTYDIGLYQLGNNQLHRDIYAKALARPGVVVLHDAVLQHFFLGSLTEAEYIDEFVYNYGAWARSEAQALWNSRSGSSQDPRYFARPMLKRIAEASLCVVVHNPAAAAIVKAHAPAARIVEIPLFFQPPAKADPASVVEFRKPFRYLFGVFGYFRESKRLIPTLKSFVRLGRICPDAGLLVAGQIHSSDLARAAAPYLAVPGVRRLGHMSEREFALASEAVDCCVNLRYPSAGETSAIAVRLMGIGKPVIMTDGPENAALPLGAYFSVGSGAGEEEHLFQTMAVLIGSPLTGEDAGKHAAQHLFRYHALEAAAEKYWGVLCDHGR